MRARTPKKRFLGFCSQNDVVLDISNTKQSHFRRQRYNFLIPSTSQNNVIWDWQSPKRRRLGLAKSKTTSFGIRKVQNDVIWDW